MTIKSVLLKLGGNAENGTSTFITFAEQVVELHRRGVQVVVVHGAGPQIDARLTEAGIESERVDGHRITTPEAMTVIRDVLVNDVQKRLVESINVAAVGRVHFSTPDRASCTQTLAVGISPEESMLFRCRPMVGRVDFQCVGDVESVDATAVRESLMRNQVPVISGVGIGADGCTLFNINADSAAAALAGDLKVDRFVMISNVDGLYRDFANREGLVDLMSVEVARHLLPALQGGMLPKVQACVDAVNDGAGSALMMSAGRLGDLTEVVFGEAKFGTEIVA